MTTIDSPFIFDWVLEHARVRPDAPAVGVPGTPWLSYRDLASTMGGMAELLSNRGVRPCDFVVQALPPGRIAVAAALGAQILGAHPVELGRDQGTTTHRAVLRQTGARVAIVRGLDAAVWAPLARENDLELVVVHPSSPPARLAALLDGLPSTWVSETDPPVSDAPRSLAVREADAAALLLFTSGSTGEPRGVVQTHRNICANTDAICRCLELTGLDRALSILPLHYCYGRSILQTHLRVGGSVFFDHRFMYPGVVLKALADERCTGFAGVPLTFELLRRQADVERLAFPWLRYVTQAGGAMHPDTIRWAREAFAPAKLFVMYGQTEATARLSYLPPERAGDKPGSIGRGLDNVELRVVDEDGSELGPNEVGQLVARGPSITPGYFRAPGETAAILRDGWLWTGDLARRDEEGFLFIVGRVKDILKLGGYRVSALEIEQVLAQHPAVSEVAVVGAPDPIGGETAVAFVARAAAVTADEDELRRFCRERLPAFKVPGKVLFVDVLPRTATGKVAKNDLRSLT